MNNSEHPDNWTPPIGCFTVYGVQFNGLIESEKKEMIHANKAREIAATQIEINDIASKHVSLISDKVLETAGKGGTQCTYSLEALRRDIAAALFGPVTDRIGEKIKASGYTSNIVNTEHRNCCLHIYWS